MLFILVKGERGEVLRTERSGKVYILTYMERGLDSYSPALS